jgi:hypothetical protein
VPSGLARAAASATGGEGLGGAGSLTRGFCPFGRGPPSKDTACVCCCCCWCWSCERGERAAPFTPLNCSLSLLRPFGAPLVAAASGLALLPGVSAACCCSCCPLPCSAASAALSTLYTRQLGRQWMPSESTVQAACRGGHEIFQEGKNRNSNSER